MHVLEEHFITIVKLCLMTARAVKVELVFTGYGEQSRDDTQMIIIPLKLLKHM